MSCTPELDFPSTNRTSLHTVELLDCAHTTETEEDGTVEERSEWNSKAEYILSTIGYSVGIGNLFRFPYVCNKNGGGAFLIPFMLSLVLIGLPLFALEVVLGQFSKRNAYTAWAICPLLKGAGLGMIIMSGTIFWYYNTILAWAAYYAVSSFRETLPWSTCDGWWNTPHCFTYTGMANTVPSTAETNTSQALANTSWEFDSVTLDHKLGTDWTAHVNGTVLPFYNVTASGANVTRRRMVSSAEEFWQHNVLQISSGFDELGHVVWYTAVALCFTLALNCLVLIKGIHSSGKVAYVTATAPYVLLTVMLIRGLTLPGAVDGIIFYIKPDFSKLQDMNVWVEAAVQVFYSLGPGYGGLIVMASFNKFHNKCIRDSIMLTFVSEGTSIFGGFAIFSVLGYMSHISGQPIDSVVSSGPGLAFIAYPEAMSLLPLPQLWAVLFFVMVITLGVDSQMCSAEVVLTTFTDMFPRTLTLRRRPLVTFVFCAVYLPISLPFTVQGGIYLFQLVDWYVLTITSIIVTLCECLIVGWIYGIRRFGEDIRLMTGRRHPLVFTVLWKFVTPCLMLVLLVITFLKFEPPTYGDYHYGTGAEVFGWAVALASFLPIPVLAVHQLAKATGSLPQRLRQTLRPDVTSWYPADPCARTLYQKEKMPDDI